jgi:predicted GNAT family N-acyltransferase
VKVIVSQIAGSSDLTDAFMVRKRVFQDEQGVETELDFDGRDDSADHFIAYDAGNAIGAARVIYLDGGAKIQRVAVLKDYRGKNIGNIIMRAILDFLKYKNINHIYLESQTHAVDFYKKLGFVVVGEEFVEADIPHVKMIKSL